MHKKNKEIRFLLSCAKLLRRKEDIEEIEANFGDDLDWDFITRQAIKHQVAPLLYYNVKRAKLPLEKLAWEKLSLLKSTYIRTLCNNLLFQTEFLKVYERLKQDGIDVIPMRGIVLGNLLYQDIGVRPTVDIDLLVKGEDFIKFEKVLLDLGYRKVVLPEEELYLRKWGSNIPYRKDFISIEAHWAIVPPRPNELNLPIWERARRMIIDGIDVKVLSIEDELISLALHLRNHTRSLLLKHLVDILELLRNFEAEIDWSYVLQQVKLQEMQYTFCFALLLTTSLWRYNPPLHVLENLPLSSLKSRFIAYLTRPQRFFKYTSGYRSSRAWGGLIRFLLLEKTYRVFSYPVMRRILKELGII